MGRQRRISRAKEIEQALLEKLDELRDQKGQLPSEAEITRLFDTSRVTVREALSSLEQKGLIVRKHGIGTFVNDKVRAIQARLNESIEFGSLIRISGYQAEVELTNWHCGPASPETASRLNIDTGAEVLTTYKTFLADGVPVVYCVNVIPLSIAVEPLTSLPDEGALRESVYKLLERWFGQAVAYQIADIEAWGADEMIAHHLDYPRGGSVLLIEEVAYNLEQQPLFLAREYYRPGVIRFQLLRKPG